MTISIAILSLSVALQLMAVFLILRFIRFSRGSWSWGAIALAIGLMASRRAITLFRLLTDGSDHTPDLVAESVALVISLLFVLGFCSIVGLLRSLQTARTQLAADLESAIKKESGLRAALDSIDEAIIAFDNDTRIMFASRPVEKTFGFSPEEVVETRLGDLVSHSESPDFEEALSRFIESDDTAGVSLRREIVGARKDGSTFPMQINVHRLVTKQARQFVATALDISEKVERERKIEEGRKRAINELEHKHEILRNLAEGVSAETGEDFFRSLVEFLGRTLNTRYALAARANEEWLDRADTLAIWCDGEYMENIDYDLAGTPCADVMVRRELCVYESDTQSLFPDDELMVEMGVHAYAGAPLVDSSGEAIGLIAVLDDKEFQDVELIFSTLKVFASRAAAELERLKSERKLNDSEAWYRGMFEATSDCIIVLDTSGNVRHENANARKALGYSHEEIVKLNAIEAIWPEIADEFRAFTSTENELHSLKCKVKCLRKDGSTFPAEIRADVVELKDEKNVLVYLRDITEGDRIQRQLQLALCSIDDSLDAVYWVRPDASFAYVNNSACHALGYTREELLSMSVLDVNAQLDAGALRDRMDAVRAHGSVIVESIHRKKDGRLFPVELLIGHLLGDGEEYFYVSARDLSERKRSESELQRSVRRIRSIIESASDAIVVMDEDHTIVEWNPQAERLFGWSYGEATGKKCNEIFTGDTEAECLFRLIAGADDSGASSAACQSELELSSKTGGRIPVEVSVTRAMTPDGVAHTAFIRDLRLRKKLEEQSIRADKLESIGVLAGGIAHDFNNLLAGVLGNIALATGSGKISPEVKEYLDEAELALSRASDLTRQLLTFAKGGAPIKEISSIESLLVETVTFSLRGSASKPVFDISGDLHSVEMDSSQISQVLHNLCINAVQAMPDGGVITVYAENITYKSAPGIRIKFSDTGIGIAEENLRKIFDPFFTTKPSGSGLGLATSYSIIKKHGGEINVESELNKGTTFTIDLPATLKEAKPKAKHASADLTGAGRILVMDDEAFLRRLAKSMLEGFGYTVETAADGLEALTKYQEALSGGRRFDLVILDLTIPGGMGGKETMSRLLEMDPQTRAIVCSGYSANCSSDDNGRSGFIGHVAKPYRPEEIAVAIKDALGVQFQSA